MNPIFFAAIVGAIWFFKIILILAIISICLVYLIEPVDKFFRRISNLLAAFFGSFVIIGIIYSVAFSFFKITKSIVTEFQKKDSMFISKMQPLLGKRIRFLEQLKEYSQDHIEKIVLQGIFMLLGLLKICAILLISFYLLIEWGRWIEKISSIIPEKHKANCINLLKKIDLNLQNWANGQIKIFCLMLCYYMVALHFLGAPESVSLSLLATILMLIPYLGVTACAIAAMGVAAQGGCSLTHMLLIGGVFLIGMIIEGSFLTPHLIGNKIGIAPILFLFTSAVLWQIFGWVGPIIATPTLCIAKAFLQKEQKPA